MNGDDFAFVRNPNGFYYLVSVDISAVTLPGAPDGPLLPQEAFDHLAALKDIALPPGLKSISNKAFNGCVSLALTSLPSGLTDIDFGAFQDCLQLALTSLPAGITGSLNDNVFGHCTSLREMSLPSITGISGSSFRECTELRFLELWKANVTSTPSSFTDVLPLLVVHPDGGAPDSTGNFPAATFFVPASGYNVTRGPVTVPAGRTLALSANVAGLTFLEWQKWNGAAWATVPNATKEAVVRAAAPYDAGRYRAMFDKDGGQEYYSHSIEVTVGPAIPDPGPEPDPDPVPPSANTTPGKITVAIGGTMCEAEKQPDGDYLILLSAGTDPTLLNDLPLDIALPKGATISPDLKSGVDFSNGPVTFTITAEDKKTRKTITITVRISEPQTAEGQIARADPAQSSVVVTYNADGTLSVEIRLPLVSGFDPPTLDGLHALLSGLTHLSFACVGADGSTVPLTPRTAGDPYLRITGTAADKAALERAALSSLTYWLKGKTTKYRQVFNPALLLRDMQITYSNEPPAEPEEPTDDGGSSGCDTGFGAFVLSASLALGFVAKRRK